MHPHRFAAGGVGVCSAFCEDRLEDGAMIIARFWVQVLAS
jgi:hypothetical protein